MSTSSQVALTAEQAARILTYATEHRMYDTDLASRDVAGQIDDAATLVNHARNALAGGNNRAEVTEILFMAEVETGTVPALATAPPASQTAASPELPAQPAASVEPAQVAAPAPPSPPAPPAPADTSASNGAEASLADTPDDQLSEALRVLQGFPHNPSIVAEMERIQAEQQRRVSASPPQAPAPPIAPSAAPVEVAAPSQPSPPQQPAQPAAVEAPIPPAVPAAQPELPPQLSTLPPVPGRPNPGVISAGGPPPLPAAQAADAPVLPGSQAPQPVQEGQLPQAQSSAQDGGRDALMAQVTVPMMQAHGLTLETLSALTNDQLAGVVANPSGAPQAPAVTQPPAPSAVDPERDRLEEQVTGPMLKAWKHGRVDVPKMGINELRLMVENPHGDPGGDVLTQARAADGVDTLSEESVPVGTASVIEPPVPPVPSAAVAEAPTPPQPEPPAAPPEVMMTTEIKESLRAGMSRLDPGPDGSQDAMAIIAREHLPIPQDIDDPYQLPNDVSKVSDDMLRSLHARAHAVEARVNWLISERQDEVGDLERLRDARKVYVRNNLPPKAEGDTGRRTKDAIEAIVEGDEEAQQYQAQIAEIEKGTNKLKVIRDNAHRDCERLSRQWSMRFREETASPTR